MILPIVFYKGKYWYYEGLRDYEGRVSLISIEDSSKGYNATPRYVHFLTPEKEQRIREAIATLKEMHRDRMHMSPS